MLPAESAQAERLAALETKVNSLCAQTDRLARRVDLLILLALMALGPPGLKVAQVALSYGLQ